MTDSGEPDELNWRRLGSRYGDAELILFKARFDTMQHPQSRAQMERLVLESVDWVNMVAVDLQGRSVMVRQYRFGIGALTLETPGGMVDPGESPLEAARRELLEETGYGGGEWFNLGAVQPNPAIHNHLCHHFLARDVEPLQAMDLGAGEALRCELLDEDELRAAVRDGSIQHALALSVLSRVYDLWPRPFLHDPLSKTPDRT